MLNIGPMEIMVVALIALIVVGPKRLPELGKTIGKGLREFRKAQDELKRSVDLGLDDDEQTRPTFQEKRFTNKRRSHPPHSEPSADPTATPATDAAASAASAADPSADEPPQDG